MNTCACDYIVDLNCNYFHIDQLIDVNATPLESLMNSMLEIIPADIC